MDGNVTRREFVKGASAVAGAAIGAAAEGKEAGEPASKILNYNENMEYRRPGKLISVHQVENAALAVQERRKHDKVETARLDEAVREMWAKVGGEYSWLHDWRCV